MTGTPHDWKPSEADLAHARDATWPSHITARGWRDIALRVLDSISRTNLSLVAAGLAFFAFLAIPAALTALVALYGLVFDPGAVGRQIAAMRVIVPADAIGVISGELTQITSSSGSKLSFALGVSVVIALWTARSGTSSLMSGLNIVYEEPEKRSLFRFYLDALMLTACGTIFAILAVALVAVLPAAIALLPLGDYTKAVAAVARWPILLVLVTLSFAAVYRYAPCRRQPRWRWVSWGAVIATLLWLGGSALFSLYVSNFASYNKTYGSLGAVVALLMWLYVSCFCVLLGGTINAEMEHQTARDSTIGAPKPIGKRRATMADTLGETK
ncbi:MAG TPA: YihY/virulence factor BrkB family protein [Stellaceae bacterium]|nr:YihY/virulence factor BrkB family protein [Stellaceae bacterium]